MRWGSTNSPMRAVQQFCGGVVEREMLGLQEALWPNLEVT